MATFWFFNPFSSYFVVFSFDDDHWNFASVFSTPLPESMFTGHIEHGVTKLDGITDVRLVSADTVSYTYFGGIVPLKFVDQDENGYFVCDKIDAFEEKRVIPIRVKRRKR